jgi:hypothetical protein
MTLALTCYSAVFMRYALAVTPKNYLLFGCHIINFSAQLTQGYRYINYWKYVRCSTIPNPDLHEDGTSWDGGTPETKANETTVSVEEKRHWRQQRRKVCRVQRRTWGRWWKKGKMPWARSKSVQKRSILGKLGEPKLDVQ